MHLQVPELPRNTQTAAGQERVLSRKQEDLLRSECSGWPAINPSTSPDDSSRTPARSATAGAMHKSSKSSFYIRIKSSLRTHIRIVWVWRFKMPKKVRHRHLEACPSVANYKTNEFKLVYLLWTVSKCTPEDAVNVLSWTSFNWAVPLWIWEW